MDTIGTQGKTFTIREIETGYQVNVAWEEAYENDNGEERYRYHNKTYAFATIGEALARVRGLVRKDEE